MDTEVHSPSGLPQLTGRVESGAAPSSGGESRIGQVSTFWHWRLTRMDSGSGMPGPGRGWVDRWKGCREAWLLRWPSSARCLVPVGTAHVGGAQGCPGQWWY